MELNSRILIVDNNRSIHEDFRKVLCDDTDKEQAELDGLESELFGNGLLRIRMHLKRAPVLTMRLIRLIRGRKP